MPTSAAPRPGRLPRRTAVTAGLLALAGATLTGCSSASAAESATSTLCASVESLQHSVAKLRDMQVSENGVAAMRDQLTAVRADLTQVVTDAKAQYGPQADRIQSDIDQLRGAAGQVRENPTADTLTAVRPALTTLATDVQALVDQVGDCT